MYGYVCCWALHLTNDEGDRIPVQHLYLRIDEGARWILLDDNSGSGFVNTGFVVYGFVAYGAGHKTVLSADIGCPDHIELGTWFAEDSTGREALLSADIGCFGHTELDTEFVDSGFLEVGCCDVCLAAVSQG